MVNGFLHMVIIPPDVLIPVTLAMGTVFVSPLHMSCHLKLHTLRFYLLNLNRRLLLPPLHRPSSHRDTSRSSWFLPPLRTLIILTKTL